MIKTKSVIRLKKWGWFFLSIVLFISALLIDKYDNSKQLTPAIHQRIQHSFDLTQNEMEKEVDELVNSVSKSVNHHVSFSKTPFFLHVYRNNQLIYWNTNQIPVETRIKSNEIKNGFYNLANGYYYIISKKKNGFLVQCAFLVQSIYQLENEYLTNDFSSSIYDGPIKLAVSSKGFFSIKDKNSRHLFYIIQLIETGAHALNTRLTFVLLLLALGSFFCALYFLIKKNQFYGALAFFVLLTLRFLSFYFFSFTIFQNQEFQSVTLFPFNKFFPTILALFVNIGILIFGYLILLKFIISKQIIFWKLIFIVIIYVLWWFILDFIIVLVENADISLALDLPFTLSLYSYLVIVLVGIIFYCFYTGLMKVMRQLYELEALKPKVWILIIAFAIGFIVFRMYLYRNTSAISLLLPVILCLISLITQNNQTGNKNIVLQLCLLALFSFVITSELDTQNSQKERAMRKLYATQLLLVRDYEVEINYSSFQKELQTDSTIQALFVADASTLIASDVEDYFKRTYFNGVWDAYDLGITVIDSLSNTLISQDGLNENKLTDLVKNHSEKSEINESIFFLNDSYLGFSYLIKQTINKRKGIIVFSLKSKKIPDEIGFPRLLLSKEAKEISGLSRYSSANYFKGKLVKQNGDFYFPTSIYSFKKHIAKGPFFNEDAYNHYVLFKGNNEAVVLSEKVKTSYDKLTSFSYVFCFWGLLLVIVNIVNLVFVKKDAYSWTLALKIQIMSVSLVVLSLVFFGSVSGLFVSRQYELYNNKTTTDKVKAIASELSNKIGQSKTISRVKDRTFIELFTEKLAAIFETDINIYDLNGYLIGGSKPEVFSLGLQSGQINSSALKELKFNAKSLYSQKENIGKLTFYSVYMPLNNGKNETVGFLNIQQFGKQRDFERQIQSFLVSIMNIFILLLAGAIIISLLVSNRLVQPLKQLQLKVRAISFGQRNQHIIYSANDEISTIVDAYNNKLDELDLAIKQLKLNERESAWREMAKQVAHEIKNPLTPIKLSVQQLLRSYDPNDLESKTKIDLVVKSIIEQVDGLVKIANDFSLFAQLPIPDKKETDLVLLVKRILPVFLFDEKVKITLNCELEQCIVKIDKDQWIQVINNLLKNAAQACSEIAYPEISICITQTNNNIQIAIKDNGCGISVDKYDKIFTPHFTTKSTGSGIGLSLVKQIIENHGGSISFTSTKSGGTVFKVLLNSKEE